MKRMKNIKEARSLLDEIQLLFLFESDEFLKLLERSMQNILSFRSFNIRNESNLEEMFELLYEIEYKYSMIQNSRFEGLEKRKENIIKILEDKGSRLIEEISKSFIIVYKEWLEQHSLLSPQTWGRKRAEEAIIIDQGVDAALYEYLRFPPFKTEQFFQDIVDNINNSKDIKRFFEEAFLDNIKNGLQSSLEDVREGYLDIQDWEGYELVGKINDPDKAEEILWDDITIDDLIKKDNYDFLELLIQDERSILSLMDDWGESLLAAIYQFVVFPPWYKYWKAQGIDKTRANIERIYKELQKISRLPLQKQFGIINQATNATHQTGSMMEYYEEQFGISENFLNALSNSDTREWDNELRDIGVTI